MEYQLFCEQLKQGILQHADWKIEEERYLFYPQGFTSDDEEDIEFIRETNWKYHRTEGDELQADYIVLVLNIEEMQVRCRFQVNMLYLQYQKKGWEQIWAIIEEQLKLVKSANVYTPIRNVESYEGMKGRLVIRAINYTDHEYELRNVVHKVYGDIALVLYAILYDNELGLGTTRIGKKVLEGWGKEADEIFEVALSNTRIMAKPRMIRNLLETFDYEYEGEAFMEKDVKSIEKWQVPAITTTRKVNGAISMFYPGVKEKIAELFGADYYVVFTSIHEARVHHVDSISPKFIFETLQEVNNKFPSDETLSRIVFRYECRSKRLEMVNV